MIRPAPYPADTRAKGWRFELDHERVRQSDTWALAALEVRPWLLMLWMTAWEQTPCGSLPQDDELIAARIGMPLEQFQAARSRLLRGWWLADDGRLYHDTLTERVLEMVERRDGERNRKAEYRARKQAEKAALLASEQEKIRPDLSRGRPDMSHGTDMGLPRDSGGSDATGTGTSIKKNIAAAALRRPARDPVDNFSPPPAAAPDCPKAARYAALLDGWERVRGKAGVFRSDDPLLAAWAEADVTEAELRAAHGKAVKRRAKARDPTPVNVGLVDVILPEVRRAPAATSALSRAQAARDPQAWALTASGLEAKGAQLGIALQPGEAFPDFKARVHAAAGLTEVDRLRLLADYGVRV